MVHDIREVTLKQGREKEVLLYLEDEKEDSKEIEEKVRDIVEHVKREGDSAIYHYLEKFDKITKTPPYSLRVSEEEIETAYKAVDKDVLSSFQEAIRRVKKFHKNQIERSWTVFDEEGSVYGSIIRPLERVALYVPGGRASYPSTVIMGVVPALIAGVNEVVISTPPDPNFSVSPYVLAVAKFLGVREIYKMGGAYAISALTYGTESVKRVDKIVGPGNIYVTLAKKLVWGDVDIDSLAGPSEVVVIGDDSSSPEDIVLDLLSQAEHDPYARAILITPSKELIKKIKEILFNRIDDQPRRDIILKSITQKGLIVKTDDIESAISVSNYIAPEHLQLAIDNPFDYLPYIKNAGAIFLGHFASVPLGDYIAGTNHILPTGRRARFSSPLGVYSFYKKMDFFFSNEELSRELGDKASLMAEVEGLFAHRDRLIVRREK